MYLVTALLLSIGGLSSSLVAADGHDGLCEATCSSVEGSEDEVCVFTTKVNLFAGELGYYQFEECGDEVNPTLAMEVGKTYKFSQAERSNYYHPLGFAYYADGAHADADELEPGIVPPDSSSSCGDDMSCPAPMYFKQGEYLGTYSNNAMLVPPTTGEDNFGLDDYEPLYFYPLPNWVELGPFDVYLKFGVDDFKQDIFYFCHIHQYMTGRIKLTKNGELISESNEPAIDYEYDSVSGHDETCGTYGLNQFQLPHPECPEKFVCDVPEDNPELANFANCINSMDCAMMAGMTTKADDEVSLFLHQMIPHHQNAVNMAKALLKTGKLTCDDLTDEDTEQADDCALEVILREIINNQNAQIQGMRSILEGKGYPETNDCKVGINDFVTTVAPETAPDAPETAPDAPAPAPDAPAPAPINITPASDSEPDKESDQSSEAPASDSEADGESDKSEADETVADEKTPDESTGDVAASAATRKTFLFL